MNSKVIPNTVEPEILVVIKFGGFDVFNIISRLKFGSMVQYQHIYMYLENFGGFHLVI